MRALAPYLLSLGFIPVILMAALWGGWFMLGGVIYAHLILGTADEILGLARGGTGDAQGLRFRLLLWAWVPVQIVLIFAAIWWCAKGTLGPLGQVGVMLNVGMVTGAVGIVYAHELIHQKGRTERLLGDILLALALYGHFRSHHLGVHHVWVATPKDAVTARRGESLYRFWARAIPQSFAQAFALERNRLARTNRAPWHPRNPFWRYGLLAGAALVTAWAVAGWAGVGLFALQALVAVLVLEQVNYVEHYGLMRARLPSGRYAPFAAEHSWDAAHRATNGLLINLQRHSDHHLNPAKRYPALEAQPDAPALPYGYPLMTAIATVPPLWRKVIHPRLDAFRARR